MSYIQPEKVLSPKKLISGIPEVLYDAKEGNIVIARIVWDGNKSLAMRWNGTEENPVGYPNSRGNATWQLLPDDFFEAIFGVAVKLIKEK